jgi:hypothetical protein
MILRSGSLGRGTLGSLGVPQLLAHLADVPLEEGVVQDGVDQLSIVCMVAAGDGVLREMQLVAAPAGKQGSNSLRSTVEMLKGLRVQP